MPHSPRSSSLKRAAETAISNLLQSNRTQSPSHSPRRRRRHGPFTPRLFSATTSPPTIPTHFPPLIASTADPLTLRTTVVSYLCRHEAKDFMLDKIPLIFDTGASVSISNTKSDFASPILPVQRTTLKGIASGLPVQGIGTVSYTITDANNHETTITIPGVLFVPDCPTRLICPRQLLATSTSPGADIRITPSHLQMKLHNKRFIIPYDPINNLPILHTTPGVKSYINYCITKHLHHSPQLQCYLAQDKTSLNPSSPIGNNLTKPQLTKLQWHQRLNHINFNQLTSWMRQGHIKVDPAVINCPDPICAACQYGKARRRSHSSDTGRIDKDASAPGDGISADQLEAGTPGIVPTNKGSPTSATYKYCNFWVDHYSRFIYITMHQKKDAKEMLASKLEFEAFCSRYNVRVKNIRADNGIYSSQMFRMSCDQQNQSLTLCGVGSHWQNGIAERTIGVVQNTARTILLHAMTHWPSTVSESFWPFAIRHAVNLHNISTRGASTRSPHELFTGESAQRSLTDYRVFGCPAYVLRKELQDVPGSARKWESRCWQGVYVGLSSLHAGNVALIYNPATSHVTQQFHVTFDESFTSVASSNQATADTFITNLLDKTSWLYHDDFATPLQQHHFSSNMDEQQITALHALYATTPDNPNTTGTTPPEKRYKAIKGSESFELWKKQECIHADVFHCTRPNAISTPPSSPPETPTNEINTYFSTFDHPPYPLVYAPTSEGALNISPPHVYQAATQVQDTLTQSAMLKAADKQDFIKAQHPEIAGLERKGVFSYHPINTLPPKARLLNAIWSYKRKRTPTGALKKHKSRLCTDGSRQQYGVDYWDTYAPVVAWSTVRLVLALSSILGLKSRQVDFDQAFTQSPIAEDVYMKIPQGWYVHNGKLMQHDNPQHRDTSHYIKLLKTLYGVKQAARAWYQHLTPGLTELGFKPSSIDPCLWFKDDCILLLYVDDCLLFAPDDAVIDTIINHLSQKYLIGEQGSVQDFLGLRITTDSQGRIHLCQEGLISSILQDLNLDNSVNKPTPAIHVLHPDHGGHPREETWNYRSIIGKLNFLAQMTRPDISMAVHNCARFSNNPTSLHEQAIKRIGRYLSGTRTKGLLYTPVTNARLNMFVDADFAGTWHKEFAHLRECVLSRTGFVITFCGCAIHWGSKLQSEIALSTTEAEYIALSTATRELIPIRRILRELSQQSPLSALFPNPRQKLPPSYVYEDNNACIALAHRDSQHRPRTKHISLKYHHLRDHISKGTINIEKVPSSTNWADIFTKPLTQVAHERLRLMMMGW
jgi:hypothetical protein